jgi:hypothetical protein
MVEKGEQVHTWLVAIMRLLRFGGRIDGLGMEAALQQQVETLNAQLDAMHAAPHQVDWETEDILAVAEFRVGCKVVVHGLTSEAGQALNGQQGVVAPGNANTGRVGVFLDDAVGAKVKAIRIGNLKVLAYPEEEGMAVLEEEDEEGVEADERRAGMKTNTSSLSMARCYAPAGCAADKCYSATCRVSAAGNAGGGGPTSPPPVIVRLAPGRATTGKRHPNTTTTTTTTTTTREHGNTRGDKDSEQCEWAPSGEAGDVYEGGYQRGKPHGLGKLTKSDGSVYQGGFKGGKPHGEGCQAFASGDVYTGIFSHSFPHGEGVLVFGARFPTKLYTRGCHWFPPLLA